VEREPRRKGDQTRKQKSGGKKSKRSYPLRGRGRKRVGLIWKFTLIIANSINVTSCLLAKKRYWERRVMINSGVRERKMAES